MARRSTAQRYSARTRRVYHAVTDLLTFENRTRAKEAAAHRFLSTLSIPELRDHLGLLRRSGRVSERWARRIIDDACGL